MDVPPDARPDATPCAIQTYYKDADGDGHGNPMMPVQSCMPPPAGTVALNDDCDDANAQRHPAHAELCDAIDNDCNGITSEVCPAGCTVRRRPAPDDAAHAYLFCNLMRSWPNASVICTGAMYRLVQIDDAAENAYVRTTADALFGAGIELYMGANDNTTEGTWVWDAGAPVPFWQGAAAGMPVGGRYTNWDGSEPNNSNNNEDCAHMTPEGRWNDLNCGLVLPFVCRR